MQHSKYYKRVTKSAGVQVKYVEKDDKLDEMYKYQKQLQNIMGHNIDDMIFEEKEIYTRDNLLGIMMELNDLLKAIKQKGGKKSDYQDRLENIVDDAFHYFLNICLVWGVNPNQLYDKYNKRNKLLIKKIKSKKSRK